MKKIITLVLVSALGGAITLGSYKYFLEEKPTVVKTHELIELPPKVVANYETNTANLESLNPNFVTAAENTINTVVHVQNTAIGRRQMTMEDLFFGRQSQRPQIGTGSGVIISSDGYIITNNHVIEGAESIMITTNNNKTYDAELIGTDPKTDIALLKINADNDLPYSTFGDSDTSKIGEWVLAVGNPFNLNSTTSYTVSGVDENGCEGNASITLETTPNPIALFEGTPVSGSIPLNVDFLNQSSNATMYSWDFGNGGLLDYSDPDNPSLSSIYEIEGIYYVELIAQNDLCSDTFGIEINALLLGDPIIFVPNVFSPNQDGTNELFIIETENIATLELIILNRWGNVMARIESLDDGWDGKSFSGNEAEEGVYFYKYTAQGNNGTELSGHGFLTLVR